ncbi:MAG: hypothetical protein U0521_12005 [Anaerolineae bacterium]
MTRSPSAIRASSGCGSTQIISTSPRRARALLIELLRDVRALLEQNTGRSLAENLLVYPFEPGCTPPTTATHRPRAERLHGHLRRRDFRGGAGGLSGAGHGSEHRR